MTDTSPARDHAEAEALHRDDLARDVARMHTAWRNGDSGAETTRARVNFFAALDRLAAAYREQPDREGK